MMYLHINWYKSGAEIISKFEVNQIIMQPVKEHIEVYILFSEIKNTKDMEEEGPQ